MATKISIITPSFNQAQFIEQTIDSVLSQGYPDLEYIIIDGGSTDGSAEIIKRYDRHLTYWVSEKDNGQSHAINKGLKLITGDVVNWLNSDDYYEPGALKAVGEAFADPRVLVLCAKSNIVSEGKVLWKSSGTDVFVHDLEKTIGRARIDQPETFFRSNAYKKVGLLNEQYHFVMDREWWIRYLLEFGLDGIIQNDNCIVNFRHQPDSKTVSQRIKFNNETIALYYSIALKAGCVREAERIKDLLAPANDLVSYSDLNIADDKAVKIINHFILHQGHEAYFMLDFKLAKSFLALVKKELLSREDQELTQRISLRSSLPEWLIKRVRRFI